MHRTNPRWGRLGDPSLARTNPEDPDGDLKAMVTLVRDLIRGGPPTLPVLDAILEHDDGAAFGSAAMLAASLRAAAR